MRRTCERSREQLECVGMTDARPSGSDEGAGRKREEEMDWSASRRIDLHSGDGRLACGDVIQLFIDRTERPATLSSVFVGLAGHSPPPSLFDRASPSGRMLR